MSSHQSSLVISLRASSSVFSGKDTGGSVASPGRSLVFWLSLSFFSFVTVSFTSLGFLTPSFLTATDSADFCSERSKITSFPVSLSVLPSQTLILINSLHYMEVSIGCHVYVCVCLYSPFMEVATLSDAVFFRRGSLLQNCPLLVAWGLAVCGGAGTAGGLGVLTKGRARNTDGVLRSTGLRLLGKPLRELLSLKAWSLISSLTRTASSVISLCASCRHHPFRGPSKHLSFSCSTHLATLSSLVAWTTAGRAGPSWMMAGNKEEELASLRTPDGCCSCCCCVPIGGSTSYCVGHRKNN